MRILALDSSGLVASVAVVEDGAVDDQVIAEYTVNYKKTHSQTLLPMLEELKKCIAEIRELRQEIVQLGGVYRGNSKTHRK